MGVFTRTKNIKTISKDDFFSHAIKYLTKETVKMATLQFRIGAIIKCFPFELENQTVFQVRMFDSKWKQVAWHTMHWIYLLQISFLLLSFAWGIWNGPLEGDLVLHLAYIMCALFGWLFITSLYLKPRECLVMLNQHRSIVTTAKETEVKIPHWASHYFVILAVYYFSFTLVGTWLSQALMFLWKPKSTMHIYAYLPSNLQENWIVFAAALLHEMTWSAWYLTTLGAFFSYWCADIFTLNDILASLTCKDKTTEGHVKLYRHLQIFLILFNDFNGSFFTVGFNTMVVATPVIFIYVLLSAFNINLLMSLMLPAIALFCIFLIMFFLPQESKVGILSAELVEILQSRMIEAEGGMRNREEMVADVHRRRILNKRIRALPSLGIRIWFLGICTLHTSQELMNQMFNNVILLLAL